MAFDEKNTKQQYPGNDGINISIGGMGEIGKRRNKTGKRIGTQAALLQNAHTDTAEQYAKQCHPYTFLLIFHNLLLFFVAVHLAP